MNRINDKGDYLFVLRNCFVFLFHFLWFKFKKFIEEVFCEKGALKFLKKPWKKSMKELILLESLILPKKNSFTGILKGLCLLIYNTTLSNKRHFKKWWHWGVFTFNGRKWGGRKLYFHFKSVRLYIDFLIFAF